MAIAKKDKLDAQPLLDFIESRGGSDRFVAQALITSVAEAERISRAIRRAKERGWVSVYAADDIICGLGGIHPTSIYGEEWWDPTYVDRQAEAKKVAA